MAPAVLGVCVRHVMSRRYGERAVIMKVQSAEICLAKTRSVCKHGVKYRGELARRTRYDTQHLRRRRLLLQRLRELARARLHRIEQRHVLDRDNRLACESCQQCNLLVREWPYLGATDQKSANGLVLPQQGNAESGSVTETESARAAIGELVGGTAEVMHVHRFTINEG